MREHKYENKPEVPQNHIGLVEANFLRVPKPAPF